MRVALHQQSVLVGSRLALVAVHHQVPREHSLRGETPLGAGREARTTSTENGGVLDLVVNLIRRSTKRGAQSGIAIGGEITLKRVRIREFETRRDDARTITRDETGSV